MQYLVTFIIDDGFFLDTVKKTGKNTAGALFLETALQALAGRISVRNHLGLAIYGIEVEVEVREAARKYPI